MLHYTSCSSILVVVHVVRAEAEARQHLHVAELLPQRRAQAAEASGGPRCGEVELLFLWGFLLLLARSSRS